MTRGTRIALIIGAALLIPVVPFAIVGELPGDRWLSGHDDSALTFALAGAGLLAGDVLLPIPSSIIGTLLGGRLGFPAGAATTFLGLTVGHCMGYGLGRLARSRDRHDLPDRPTLLALFLSRPVPVLAEAATFAAGAGGVGFTSFLVATSLGNAIYALGLAGNGAALLPGGLAGPGLVLPMLLPVGAWLTWKHVQRQRAARGDA